MRFFTFEYEFSGEESTPEIVFAMIGRYEAYIVSIREQLSASLCELVDHKFHLHDARLLDFTNDGVGRILTLHLLVDTGHILECVYHGLLAFNCIRANTEFRERGTFGEVVTDELHLHSSSDFEHRLLFRTGAELHIRFESFSYTLRNGGNPGKGGTCSAPG